MMRAKRLSHLLLTMALLNTTLMVWPAQRTLAQDDHVPSPKVSAALSETDDIWVGQAMVVQVRISTPGYFSNAVSFDIPDPEGVLLMPPADHPVMSTDTIDGTHYTIQQYELRTWPMRAGPQAIPPVSARFTYKRNPLDTESITAEVSTTALPFSVKRPPGSEQLGTVISARNLVFEESWSPVPGDEEVKAGTTFTRTITFKAPDMPGMIFPPFPADDIDGLGVYEKRQLQDSNHRGTLVGVRQDEITYLCQRPGQFTIPETRFTWFDLDSQELRTQILPERTIHVVTNPAMASLDVTDPAGFTQALASSRTRNKWIGGAIALLIITGLAYLASRNQRIRNKVRRAAQPFKPVHLQPLNPTERKSGSRSGS